MTDTPATPEACRAEQERVKGLLEGATNPDSWYWQPGWGLQCHFPDGLGLLVPDEQKAGDMLLMEAAPRLARAHAALLAAHAEALADVERLRKNRDQIATDNETLSVWNAKLEAEMRGYRASRNAAQAGEGEA